MMVVAAGFVPRPSILSDGHQLYIAIGILGATVMPHNLYLHSSVVQTRRYEETPAGRRMAVRYAFLDSTIALTCALFINAAILVVAAATFHTSGHTEVAEIQDAYQLLTPLLGVAGASAVFALALLASGQNSTLTGTLVGEVVMEGFLNVRIRPWLRRLITRLIEIVPAGLTAIFFGASGTAQLLILSQVILSLQLSFAVFPLVRFTSDRAKMGEFVNPGWLKTLAYGVAVVIAALNALVRVQAFGAWVGLCPAASSSHSSIPPPTRPSSRTCACSPGAWARRSSWSTWRTAGWPATSASSTCVSRKRCATTGTTWSRSMPA